MLAKRPNPTPDDYPLAELETSLAADPAAKMGSNVVSVDFATLTKTQPKTTWPDYEEFFPTPSVEATEAITTLSPALLDRRCYWCSHWPRTTVFRIKDIDPENNTVYLNIVYRWVRVNEIQLLKAKKPQRPPKDIELTLGEMPF